MIEVRNLSKHYGTTKALNNVSFKIEPGEVIGLLGPNGAGKTTTLNIMTGVLLPTKGEVTINGYSLADHGISIKKNIGYLAENNPLYENLLVKESLHLAGELKDIPVAEFRKSYDEVVQIVGLQDVLHKQIDTLSKGYRQRVGMAQALLGDPQILILDEPTEGLDPNQRQEVRELIRRLGSEHTVLLSTHVMQEVEAICQKVIILNNGEIAEIGDVQDIKRSSESGMQVEVALGGERASDMRRLLDDSFGFTEDESGLLVVEIKDGNVEELYQLVASKSDNTSYITHLRVREEQLEDVFKRVTQS